MSKRFSLHTAFVCTEKKLEIFHPPAPERNNTAYNPPSANLNLGPFLRVHTHPFAAPRREREQRERGSGRQAREETRARPAGDLPPTKNERAALPAAAATAPATGAGGDDGRDIGRGGRRLRRRVAEGRAAVRQGAPQEDGRLGHDPRRPASGRRAAS